MGRSPALFRDKTIFIWTNCQKLFLKFSILYRLAAPTYWLNSMGMIGDLFPPRYWTTSLINWIALFFKSKLQNMIARLMSLVTWEDAQAPARSNSSASFHPSLTSLAGSGCPSPSTLNPASMTRTPSSPNNPWHHWSREENPKAALIIWPNHEGFINHWSLNEETIFYDGTMGKRICT